MKQVLQKLMVIISLITASNYAQTTFQEDIMVPGHLADLNTVELQDGSNHYIVAGTIIDSSLDSRLTLTRIDNITGNIIWHRVYNNPSLKNIRGFDIINFRDEGIAITGSVKANGTGDNSTYVALINASTGVFMYGKRYELQTGFHNSQGLHIIYTEQLINGDPTPGFVIGGFTNNAYSTNISGNNVGFVLRVDMNLNQIWLKLLDGNLNTNNDYDIVNNITEVDGGYFITGGISALVNSFSSQKGGVLAVKLDNLGNLVWKNNYVLGNAYDVGADAYYDASTDEIYLLANYSITHHFGVTVLDNASGIINFSKSWRASSNSLDKYGFKINSTLDPDHLVISGYVREAYLPGPNGVAINTQSVPFVYVFKKSNGNQVLGYQYNVPYVNPASINDFFYFWSSQMPVAYYPDISLTSRRDESYFHVAYRTRVSVFSDMELIKTNQFDFKNICKKEELHFSPYSINILQTQIYLSNAYADEYQLEFYIKDGKYREYSCNRSSTINEENNKALKSSSSLIKLYPNPANHTLNVELQNETIQKIEINSITGQTVYSKQGNNSSINIENLSSGLYIVNVYGKNQKRYTSKFIKK